MSTPGPSATGSASATITSTATLTSAPSSASSTASGSSSSSSQGPQVHTVKAGSGGFKFEPAELKNVSVGDIITFEFYPPDHSVARAEFGSACVPYEYTGKNKTGFWSGTQYVSDVDHLKYWNLTINSTEPIFYYCAAPQSCTDQHMVGVVNPNDTQTLDDQIKAASEATFQVKPGDPIPAEGSSTLTAVTASATATQTPASNGDHRSHGLSGGAIAGIVVGAVAFLAICAALFFYIGRTKSLKEVIDRRDATIARSTPDPNTYNSSSPGFPPAPFSPGPFSPDQQQAEYGGQLPAYGQHNATDAHPGGWTSPQTSPQPQMVQVTPGQDVKDYPQGPHEMASPTPEQQTFRAELEAPLKSPR